MVIRVVIAALVLAGSVTALVLLGRAHLESRRETQPPAPESAAVAPEFPPDPAPAPAAAEAPVAQATDPAMDELRRRLIAILQTPIVGDDERSAREVLADRLAALDEALAGLGPESVDLLYDLLRSEADFLNRWRLILALGRIGSDHAADLIVEHYWRIFGGEQETEINYTIEALGLVDSPHSFDLLTGLIENEIAHTHRHRFVEQLGYHSDKARAVPTFLAVADPDRETYFKARSRAALALKWANDRSTAPKIEALLDREPDKYVRQALCGTLGDLGDPGSLRKLEAIALEDENFQTRLSAIRAISRIGGAEARRIMQEVVQSEVHDAVKREAARALEELTRQG